MLEAKELLEKSSLEPSYPKYVIGPEAWSKQFYGQFIDEMSAPRFSDYKPSKSAHDSYKAEAREREEKARRVIPGTARLEGRDGFLRYESNRGDYATEVVTCKLKPFELNQLYADKPSGTEYEKRTFYYAHNEYDHSRKEQVAVYREV